MLARFADDNVSLKFVCRDSESWMAIVGNNRLSEETRNSINRTVQSKNPHQVLIAELELMLRARYPLLYIVGAEEEPIDEVLKQLANQFQPSRQIRWWDR